MTTLADHLNGTLRAFALLVALVAPALGQDYQRGSVLPLGDTTISGWDIEQGRSYTIRGSGGGRSGKVGNGSQLAPASNDQPFLIRIGEFPRGGTATGCSIRDLSFWARSERDPDTRALHLLYQGDGLVLRSWGNLLIENVGFAGCKRGLVLESTQKGTGLLAKKCWFANNGTGIFVDLSRYANRVVNRIEGASVNGNDVGIEIVAPAPKPLVIRDLYSENNWTASLIHHKGELVLDGCYVEESPRDIKGTEDPRDDILVPGVAILGGKVTFKNVENAHYTYVAPTATFEAADAQSSNNIGYIVLVATDPRVPEFARLWKPKPDENGRLRPYRILVVDQPWTKGAELTVRGVRPIP